MRYLFFLALFSLAGFTFSCQHTPESTLPRLLDRHEALWQGKEWDHVQNLYGKYRQQLQQNPNEYEAKLNLAQLFVNEARITGEHGHYYPAALKMIDEILQQPIENKDALFRTLVTKAGVELSLHEFGRALRTGQQALEMNRYYSGIYGVMVDANVELGRYDEAVKMADRMVEIRPDLRSYARVSYLREIHGKPEGAIEAMKLAVSAGYPGMEQTSWTRLRLGKLYEQYGEVALAREQYQRALAERPNYPFATAALAELEMDQENYEQAEKLLKEACRIIPEVGFYEQLATLYKRTGRQEAFNRLIPEILAMLSDDVQNGHNMNFEYAQLYGGLLEDYDRALTYALEEYDKRPDNIDINGLLADIYYRKGAFSQAGQHLEKAMRTNSRDPKLVGLKKKLNTLT